MSLHTARDAQAIKVMELRCDTGLDYPGGPNLIAGMFKNGALFPAVVGRGRDWGRTGRATAALEVGEGPPEAGEAGEPILPSSLQKERSPAGSSRTGR